MNIAALSVVQNHANVRQDVSVALMKKTIDTVEQQQGTLLDKMLVDTKAISHATEPQKGGNIDLKL